MGKAISVAVSLDLRLLTRYRTLTVDESVTKLILNRCRPLVPELLNEEGEFEVLREQVGLRPTRTAGPRVELEETENGKFVCHNYGHHGAGYVMTLVCSIRLLTLPLQVRGVIWHS